ncbi:hypothetical protein CVT26_001719 [Gymnopilus dilepis]|uniref:Cytochrome P450 n=1 Tax=Gymnopilus dilepis TaxID=231916 RepID=A0A409VRB6_9AGAR|nr:hypothetical protein CVT26_001719 [Gymnopilus dilepis]
MAGLLESTAWRSLCLWVVVFLLATKILRISRRASYRALPPGPHGLPFLGNVLQVPTKMPWFKFTEWAQEFGQNSFAKFSASTNPNVYRISGPIFSLDMAGHRIIVLNSYKVASDLLDRRSNIYSDRPRFIVAGEILTGGLAIVFARYGPMLRKEAASATLGMLQDPASWNVQIKRASASAILSAIYGWPSLSNNDDPLLKRIHNLAERVTEGVTPGTYLVDLIPALNYLPPWAAKWKRDGLLWHQQTTEMLEGFIRDVEQRMVTEPSGMNCFVSTLVQAKNRHDLTEKELAWLAGIIFLAGAEAITETLFYFILAMLLYPDVKHKAQAEIDAVVGRDRPPTIEDVKNLPYVQSVVTETLRWRPAAPMAVPRRVDEDDYYEGYLIPKGATVITNIWAMNRDPSIFPDFDEFRPERFLDGVPEYTHSTGHATFGFGKRQVLKTEFEHGHRLTFS